MIIVTIMGGLGNQMFQYAIGKALSLEQNEEIVYDTAWYYNNKIATKESKDNLYRRLSLNHFNITLNEKADWPHIKRYLRWIARYFPFKFKILHTVIFNELSRKANYHHHPEVMHNNTKNIYLIGHWQNEKYFSKYRNELLHDFQIMTPQTTENKCWSEEIKNSNSVSLHVRRTDYPSQWTLSIDYYQRAIKYISKRVENPVFFIFSDDIQWVKDNLKIPYPTHFMTQNSQKKQYEDMRLMSQCKYNIIANSSFSWWGAWLNQNQEKIIIAPNGWIPGSTFQDIIPDNWIQL